MNHQEGDKMDEEYWNWVHFPTEDSEEEEVEHDDQDTDF